MMALEQDNELGGVYWLLLICDVNEAAIWSGRLVIGVGCHGCHKELLGRAIPQTNFQVRQVAQHLEGAGGKGDDGRTRTGRELTTAYIQNGPAIIHLGSKACSVN